MGYTIFFLHFREVPLWIGAHPFEFFFYRLPFRKSKFLSIISRERLDLEVRCLRQRCCTLEYESNAVWTVCLSYFVEAVHSWIRGVLHFRSAKSWRYEVGCTGRCCCVSKYASNAVGIIPLARFFQAVFSRRGWFSAKFF